MTSSATTSLRDLSDDIAAGDYPDNTKELIRVFADLYPDEDISLMSYAFGDVMYEPVHGWRYPVDFLYSKQTSHEIPLAMVLCGEVEVSTKRVDWTEGDKRSREVPRRIIGPGEFLGVFEVLDGQCGLTDVLPQWYIQAGTHNAVITFTPTVLQAKTRAIINRLAEAQGLSTDEVLSIVEGLAPLGSKSEYWKFLQYYNAHLPSGKRLTTEIAILPSKLFQSDKVDNSSLLHLFRAGWIQSSSLRNLTADNAWVNQNLTRMMSEMETETGSAAGALDVHRAVLHSILLIGRGDLPVHIPLVDTTEIQCNKDHSMVFYLNGLVAAIEHGVNNYELALFVPAHLEIGQCGILSLSQPHYPNAPRKSPSQSNAFHNVDLARFLLKYPNILKRVGVEVKFYFELQHRNGSSNKTATMCADLVGKNVYDKVDLDRELFGTSFSLPLGKTNKHGLLHTTAVVKRI